LSHGSGSGESKGIRELENMIEFHSKILTEGNFENAFGESDTATILNGSLSTLMQVLPSFTVSHTVRLVHCIFSETTPFFKFLFSFKLLHNIKYDFSSILCYDAFCNAAHYLCSFSRIE
jgi:hypothetical protein